MPSYFIPARSSRHRTACFALYRALLRQVPQIPLPREIATGWGKVNPIKHYVRTGFRRNKNDTSARLVTAALRNGYRFLDLLAAARSASSPEHASVLTFLEGRLANYKKNLATWPPPPPPPPPSKPPISDYVPLIKRVPGPGLAYESTVRPRPLAELSGGVRRIPRLYRTNETPFLFLHKPQPLMLTVVLRNKFTRRYDRIGLLRKMIDEDLEEADEEEAWDREMDALAAREGVSWAEREASGKSYRDGVEVGIEYLKDKLEEEKDDLIARGNALLEIVERETELAEKEEVERKRLQRAQDVRELPK